jgi:hypothetical protein
MRAHRLAVAPPTDVTNSSNDLFRLTLQQQTALLVAPAAACCRTPVLAEGRDLSEVLCRMLKVEQFMYLLCRQA